MNSSAKRVLILGGTGFVGRHVCEKLTRMGCSMTVITRRASQAAAIQNLPRVRVLEGDVYNSAFLAQCMAQHDVVINLIAILHGTEAAFDKAHVQLPQVIAEACLTSGVKRLIHISALGASLDGPSTYQRSKAQGEAVLQQAGLDLTLLQPSVIFGADDKFLNLFAQLQQIAPVVPLAGARTRFQPVWVEDVASAVARCVMDAKTQGHTYEICGPETWTLKELVQKSGQWAGIKGLGNRESL
ncbi:MAG: complex I NDUFA9 subunit family protein [Limnohabitans sp.]